MGLQSTGARVETVPKTWPRAESLCWETLLWFLYASTEYPKNRTGKRAIMKAEVLGWDTTWYYGRFFQANFLAATI